MSLNKIVTGSLAGVALAWSAGANATIQDWQDGADDASSYALNQVALWCFGTEGTESWQPCVAIRSLYNYLSLQESSWGLDFVPDSNHNYWTQDYRDGVASVAAQCLWNYYYYSGSGGS